MTFAEIRAATVSRLKAEEAHLEALDLISEHRGDQAQMERLRVEIAADGETAKALKTEIRVLSRKKTAVSAELEVRVRASEVEFTEQFALLQDAHAQQVRDAEAEFNTAQRKHSARMKAFGVREHEAEEKANKAEKYLEKARREIAA